jgi:hypothetical protein
MGLVNNICRSVLLQVFQEFFSLCKLVINAGLQMIREICRPIGKYRFQMLLDERRITNGYFRLYEIQTSNNFAERIF